MAASNTNKKLMTPHPLIDELMDAIYDNDFEKVKDLFARGATANDRDEYGGTPLMYAADSENASLELVQFLLDNGARVNDTDIDGIGALLDAVKSDRADIAALLLDNGARIDHQSYNQFYGGQVSALMEAAYMGSHKVLRLLLDRGADLDLKDAEGMTALDIAVDAGDEESARMLRDAAEQRAAEKAAKVAEAKEQERHEMVEVKHQNVKSHAANKPKIRFKP